MSASAFFLSASSTKTHCQPCALEPVGAWTANSRHSSSTSRGTGFSRSSRLRTERVVVRTSSTDKFKVIPRDYIRAMAIEFTQEVSSRLESDHYGWLTTVAKSGQPVPRLVWFYFDGSDVIVYSMPNAAKVRHIKNHPRVSLNLDSDGNGAGIIVVGGEAQGRRGGRRRPRGRSVLGEVQGGRRAVRDHRGVRGVQHPAEDHRRQGLDDTHAG